MPSLLLPDSVIAAEIDAERERECDTAEHWSEELKRIDQHLSLVKAKPHATELTPGYWHIKRSNPGVPDSFFPLAGPNGEYREPGSWMLENLKAEDLWNPRVHRDKEEAKRRLREARRRAKALQAEQRRDHMAEAARAAKRLKSETGFTKRTDLKGKP